MSSDEESRYSSLAASADDDNSETKFVPATAFKATKKAKRSNLVTGWALLVSLVSLAISAVVLALCLFWIRSDFNAILYLNTFIYRYTGTGCMCLYSRWCLEKKLSHVKPVKKLSHILKKLFQCFKSYINALLVVLV